MIDHVMLIILFLGTIGTIRQIFKKGNKPKLTLSDISIIVPLLYFSISFLI